MSDNDTQQEPAGGAYDAWITEARANGDDTNYRTRQKGGFLAGYKVAEALARRSQPQPVTDAGAREAIARVIDPTAWILFHNANALTKMKRTVSEWRIAPSLAKADAILALLPRTIPEGWRDIASVPIGKPVWLGSPYWLAPGVIRNTLTDKTLKMWINGPTHWMPDDPKPLPPPPIAAAPQHTEGKE